MDAQIENIDERLRILIAKLTLKYNYWGYLFSRVRRRSNNALPSIMGVGPELDGSVTLYYNPDLIKDTDDKNITYILAHEGFHLLNKHISRLLRIIANEISPTKKQIKMKIWNIAADCCVNVQAKIPKILKINGQKVENCRPELYNLPEGKASEFYYHRLLKDMENNQQKTNEEYTQDIQDRSDQLDDHSTWGDIKEATDLSVLSRKVDNYISKIILDSTKSFSRDKGDFPSNILELIEEVLKPPKAPYYQIIRKLVRGTRVSKFKRAYMKINRKRGYVFSLNKASNIPVISPFPGRTRDLSFDIALLLDTSGSMSKDDILEGLSGIKNIIENDKNCKVTVLENDAKLQKEYEVKKIRDIQFNVSGRGGTILRPGLERAKELNPDVCLVFTDGYIDNINGIPRKLIPKKIIWVVQKSGTIDKINKTGFIVRI